MHGFLHHTAARAVSLAILLFLAAASVNGLAATEPGLTDPELQELESLLRDLGFDPGAVDGVVDDATLAAIGRYQDFASLPGDPEANQALLTELRGVAAAFAALRNPVEPAPEPAAAIEPETMVSNPPDGGALETTEPDAPEPVETGKVIVPPPPAPPKLKPQVAALPPATSVQENERAESSAVDTDEQAPDEIDPAAERQARIDAALQPHRQALADGSLTRTELARQFNQEGRQLLAAADYEAAIIRFDVAIFLDAGFAGAYSNRGTAHELMGDRETALDDFDQAKRLGFGGFRSN